MFNSGHALEDAAREAAHLFADHHDAAWPPGAFSPRALVKVARALVDTLDMDFQGGDQPLPAEEIARLRQLALAAFAERIRELRP